jgi:polyhydroxybutyrate depolymerase
MNKKNIVSTAALILILTGAYFIFFNNNPADTGKNSSVSFGGLNRTYILHIPANYDPHRSYPLMVVFHGSGGTGAEMEHTSDFDAVADQNGFFVAYLDSVGAKWVMTGANNDITYSEKLIQTIENAYPIDQKRVYISGFSQGGGMVEQLACNFTANLAGAADVSENLNPASESGCLPSQPIKFILFHGTADPISPYNGGPSAISGGTTYSAEQTAQFWAKNDGCASVPTTAQIADKLNDGSTVTDNKQVWSGCKGNTNVVFYTIKGGGHTWPGNFSGAMTYGPTSENLNASQIIWQTLTQ